MLDDIMNECKHPRLLLDTLAHTCRHPPGTEFLTALSHPELPWASVEQLGG